MLEETGIDVEVGELVCTMLWEREHDRRRNLLAFFFATPVDATQRPRPQSEEGIEEAACVVPSELDAVPVDPLNQVILERSWESKAGGFHVAADISVEPDGTQSYRFRPQESLL